MPTRSYCGIQQNCKLQNLTNFDLLVETWTPLELLELFWEYKSSWLLELWHSGALDDITQSANINHAAGQWKSIDPDDTISTPGPKIISRLYVITDRSVSENISHCQVNAADTVDINYAMQNRPSKSTLS